MRQRRSADACRFPVKSKQIKGSEQRPMHTQDDNVRVTVWNALLEHLQLTGHVCICMERLHCSVLYALQNIHRAPLRSCLEFVFKLISLSGSCGTLLLLGDSSSSVITFLLPKPFSHSIEASLAGNCTFLLSSCHRMSMECTGRNDLTNRFLVISTCLFENE